MATRIPHLLEPYLALPPECAYILITGVLGASTNWLVLRYLYSCLSKSQTSPRGEQENGEEQCYNVVLVSFMRDFAFWKEDAGRLGLDLEILGRAGRFVFVDGLTGLYVPPIKGEALPVGRRKLMSPALPDVRRDLLAAIDDVSVSSREGLSARTMLIVDQPDFLLASTVDLPPAPTEEPASIALRHLLLELQDKVDASIFTVTADQPLVETQETGLEKAHAELVLSLAHFASMVVGLRLLDTGSASDVSGVMRITAGGGDDGMENIEEGELLYFVSGDGSVKVFHRGQ